VRALVWYNERVEYELAQQLRDAGFPQGGKGTQTGPSDKLVWRAGDRVYVPTLSELIEACDSEWFYLHKNRDGKWKASNHRIDTLDYPTPDEAVARLWLALHKK
jgi:hypothetical protein